MLTIIWEFRPKPACYEDFINAYKADGRWAKLFAQAKGFQGTQLIQDKADQNRFITIDQWDTQSAYDTFQKEFGQAYQQLDQELEGLNNQETLIGNFVTP